MIGRVGLGLRLDDLARSLPFHAEVLGDGAVRVCGVRHDSRAVQPGELFVARKGNTVDGARFVGDALARGAAAVMAAPGSVDAGRVHVPLILVEEPSTALAYAASTVYGDPSRSLDVVGVTGTNGKTTTTHLVRAAIDGALRRPSCGLMGTTGYSFADWAFAAQHTTPESDEIARVMATIRDRGATHLAMEVSSHALQLERVRAVRFRVAALTNVTQDHLDFHGSMRAYADAKASLFLEYAPMSAVLNVDDPLGRDLAARLNGGVVRVSARIGAQADVVPRVARVDASGIKTTVRTPRGDLTIASRLMGTHNLENLLLALGVAHALELDIEAAANALSAEPAPPGRLERCDVTGDDVTVLVDYAHTPDALKRVLEAVRVIATGRVWCVFGCGGARDATKRAPMGEVVGRGADVAVVTNDNPRTEDPISIAQAVAAGVRNAGIAPVVELDRRRAIQFAVRSATSGDVVLVAGKGHEDYQVVGDVKHPFDDRIEAREALRARRHARGVT